MKSIMQTDKTICYLCHERANYYDGNLEEHHIFGGTANRDKSEIHGLKVYIHGLKCHREGPGAVHKNRNVDLALKAAGQQKFEESHSREEFMDEFGRNWL